MNRDPVYLQRIQDAIERIDRYVVVGHERFLAESHWQDAVIRQFEIVGQAAKRISPQLRARYLDAAWLEAAAMRDILIHSYADVDLSMIWNATQTAIPKKKKHIEEFLKKNFLPVIPQ